jgi:hypothetical protein
MFEGRPRESLVLYDNPIEVCKAFEAFRLLVVLTQMILLRNLLDVIWI